MYKLEGIKLKCVTDFKNSKSYRTQFTNAPIIIINFIFFKSLEFFPKFFLVFLWFSSVFLWFSGNFSQFSLQFFLRFLSKYSNLSRIFLRTLLNKSWSYLTFSIYLPQTSLTFSLYFLQLSQVPFKFLQN